MKRATEEGGDFIESLIKEMKVLTDEIDRFLEVAPDITMIRIVAGDEYLLSGRSLVLCQRTGHIEKSQDEVFALHPGI